MDGKIVPRIGAIAFVAFACLATAIDMQRSDDGRTELATPRPAIAGRDPLDTELARCGALGEAGSRDLSCLKAWAENRRRFLGQRTAFAPSAPSDAPAASGGR